MILRSLRTTLTIDAVLFVVLYDSNARDLGYDRRASVRCLIQCDNGCLSGLWVRV